MAAEYDFQRKPNPKGDGELQPLYPRIVNRGTITTKRLVSDISHASSFTPGDIEGLLAAFEDRISYYLSEGHHVQLGNMGYFSAGLVPVRWRTRRRFMHRAYSSAKYIFGYPLAFVSSAQVLWNVSRRDMASGIVPKSVVRNVTVDYWLFWRHILSLPAKIIAVLRDF